MNKSIKFFIVFILHLSFIIFTMALFLELSKFIGPVEQLIEALHKMNVNLNLVKNLSFVFGLSIYLIAVAWSLYEISSNKNYAERRVRLLKRTIILHPVSGLVAYFLSSSMKSLAKLMTNRIVVSWFYYLRITFFLIFLVTLFGMFLISNLYAVLSIFIFATFASIGMHYIFEVSIFTDILSKSDNEIFDKGFDLYLSFRQPILAYGGYFKSHIK